MRDRWISGAVDPDFAGRFCTSWREREHAVTAPPLDDPTTFALDNVDFHSFIRMCWLVQTWSVQWAISGGISAGYSGLMSPRNRTNTSEFELQDNEEWRLGGNIGCSASGFVPSLDATWGLNFLGGHLYVPPAGNAGPIFRPRFTFGFNQPATNLRVFTLRHGTPTEATPAGTATVDGFTCPIFWDGAEPFGFRLQASISISAVKFWPRRDHLGANPVYNSATGATLLNPLSAPFDLVQANHAIFGAMTEGGPAQPSTHAEFIR